MVRVVASGVERRCDRLLDAVLVLIATWTLVYHHSLEVPHGTTWAVVTVRLEPLGGATLAFGTDGTVSGTSGCNTYTATYEVNGEFITVGPLTLAPVACDASAVQQASVFEDSLPKAASWKILSSGNLRLSGPADTQGRYYIEASPSRP